MCSIFSRNSGGSSIELSRSYVRRLEALLFLFIFPDKHRLLSPFVINIFMLVAASKFSRALLSTPRFFVADYKQVYDGILNFEDKGGLGDDLFQLKSHALEFARQKLAPFSLEWEKKNYFPV